MNSEEVYFSAARRRQPTTITISKPACTLLCWHTSKTWIFIQAWPLWEYLFALFRLLNEPQYRKPICPIYWSYTAQQNAYFMKLLDQHFALGSFCLLLSEGCWCRNVEFKASRTFVACVLCLAFLALKPMGVALVLQSREVCSGSGRCRMADAGAPRSKTHTHTSFSQFSFVLLSERQFLPQLYLSGMPERMGAASPTDKLIV